MQRDAVAFAVVHDGAKAVRSDRVQRLQHLAAVRFDLRDRVADAPLVCRARDYSTRPNQATDSPAATTTSSAAAAANRPLISVSFFSTTSRVLSDS